jgi:class 3 adenylate cyclase
MPRIPILRLRRGEAPPPAPQLASYQPKIDFKELVPGIDNLRHDVVFSSKSLEAVRKHVSNVIARHGGVERVLAEDAPVEARKELFIRRTTAVPSVVPVQPRAADLKPLLLELKVAALNAAKAKENLSVDLLGRVAIVKFLRAAISEQFAEVLERCRTRQKGFEGIRETRALQVRETVAAFQVEKKAILRRTAQEIFQHLREIEKETLARMRRSLFGEAETDGYELLLNPLLFTEDGRDDQLNAEQYVMWGNFEQDDDRFVTCRRLAGEFLRAVCPVPGGASDETLDGWLNVPENAVVLVGSGQEEDSPEARAQYGRLQGWIRMLEESEMTEHVLAAYEAVPLLAEYSPLINAQQLKNALVSRRERARVEKLLSEHGRQSAAGLRAAVQRMGDCSAADWDKTAARFLFDLMRYHRDLRRLQALNSAADEINVIQNDRLRELSAMNGLLYEFLPPQEATQRSNDVVGHVVLKADVRDSTRLTRRLVESGLNPASYFSLNFYDPVNNLLARYGAKKVFLEGDAIIVALLETAGDPSFAVGRACILAREILEIVRGYNERLEKGSLPALELGIGICYQEAAPLYLMDGERPIMISDALNESDRLASCHKGVRGVLDNKANGWHVFAMQIPGSRGVAYESTMLYNRDGICLSQAAFERLAQEISLRPVSSNVPTTWPGEPMRLHRGLVPIDREVFRSLIIRESKVPVIDLKTLGVANWTGESFYEVCTSAAVYDAPQEKGAAAGK